MPRGANDYQTAQIQGRLWTPAVLRPFAWWDAADISTVAQSGGVITKWSDKSGNGRHATGGAATYSVESFNGLNAISFNGSTNMSVTSPGSSSVAIAAAVRPTASGAGSRSYHGICATGGGSGAGAMLLAKVDNGAWGTWSLVPYPSSGDNPLVANKNYILVMSGLGSGSFAQNGAGVGTYSATEGQVDGHIGGFSAGTQGFTGFICEIVWLDAAMSIASQRAVEGHLSWKWGIPLAADHPYANRPPLIGD